MSDTADRQLPAWFDKKLHLADGAHVMERATGLYLDGDAVPLSGPVRARRLAELGRTTDAANLVSDESIATAALHLEQDAGVAPVATAKRAAKPKSTKTAPAAPAPEKLPAATGAGDQGGPIDAA